MTAGSAFCTICLQSHRKNENWFLLLENRWTDHLKILGWNEKLASYPRAHAACGVAHVQQLVVHWVTTGTLDYPFACSRSSDMEGIATPTDVPVPRNEPDTAEAVVLGELAVDRESMERILIENPESLGSLLAALSEALSGDESRRQAATHNRVEEEAYDLVDA
jgi:hypothetical protein